MGAPPTARCALAALATVVTAACSGAPSPSAPAPDGSLEALGAEYRRLRAIPGHARGGTWNDDADRYGGRKHVVMQELGQRLAHASRAQVVAVMGPPDAIARAGEDGRVVVTAPATEALIYFWRGWHDYLFFEIEGDAVRRADWWMAYE